MNINNLFQTYKFNFLKMISWYSKTAVAFQTPKPAAGFAAEIARGVAGGTQQHSTIS
jgi:hypothetical protein